FIKEKTKRLAQITGVGAMVTIVLNLLLIRTLGMEGAALATLGSYGVMAFLLYRYSQQAMFIPYNMVRNILTMILSLGLVLLINQGHVYEEGLNFWLTVGIFLMSVLGVISIQTSLFGYWNKKNPTT
ncbi:MAG: hypothetical protein EBR32_06075, partial [Bacteroidetes bacterium]|nr:hypothetical protein [Bacteroidota bacterium]